MIQADPGYFKHHEIGHAPKVIIDLPFYLLTYLHTYRILTSLLTHLLTYSTPSFSVSSKSHPVVSWVDFMDRMFRCESTTEWDHRWRTWEYICSQKYSKFSQQQWFQLLECDPICCRCVTSEAYYRLWSLWLWWS